jgi:hypothetical protein
MVMKHNTENGKRHGTVEMTIAMVESMVLLDVTSDGGHPDQAGCFRQLTIKTRDGNALELLLTADERKTLIPRPA